jgi:PAS domain S-box-containing protein
MKRSPNAAAVKRSPNAAAVKRSPRSPNDPPERAHAHELAALVDGLRRSERAMAEAQRLAHIGSWEWDLVSGTSLRSDELHRIYGVEPGTIPGTPEAFLAFVHPEDRARVRAAERAAMTGEGPYAIEYRGLRGDGSIRRIHDEAELIRDAAGVPLRIVGTVQDITDRVAAEAEMAQLVAAVEQTADAVWIKDAGGGLVTYANRAFCELYGYEPEEIVGRHAGLLHSGRHEHAFFDAIWASVASGKTWTGLIINRQRDGELIEVESVISGIRDDEGHLISYMQTDRDVTRERALEGELVQRVREREIIEAALKRIDPGSPPEVIASDACAEIVALPSVESAMVIALHSGDHGTVLAVAGRAAPAFASNRELPEARARHLLARATDGIWTESWRARPDDGNYGEQLTATGLREVAYAPMRGPEGVVGVVAIGIHDGARQAFIEQLPVLATLASMLSALLSRGLEARTRADDARAEIQAILDAGAFTPFFQPIVELRSGAVVGYEALSRFGNGSPPDVTFALAARSGLGLRLETATMRAAIEAATVLPAGAYLSLNASPALIRSGELEAIVHGYERPIVVEITEHVAIDDYAAIRADLAILRPAVRLAVDDAGAGYASLRHILELAPDFVKLDIGLIRGIDADPARQALIAGMGYFGMKRGIRLVAEGIETATELEHLRSLGISYGQGYLLGRPQDSRNAGPLPTKLVLPGMRR